MKRTSKVLVSAVLLVTMLANLLPMAVFAVGPDDEGFYYQRTSVMTPGKEYLIVNTDQAGTGYALKPADGADTGNKTSTDSQAVTIDASGKIAGTAPLEALEWEFVQSSAAFPSADGAKGSVRYMLQNKSTGAYLWNPAYETDSENVGTSLTPLQDQYNGSTFAVFDYSPTVTAIAGLDNIIAGINNSDASFAGPCLQLKSHGDSGVVINFNRTPLDASTFKYVQYTYHSAINKVNHNEGAFFPATGDRGFSADTRYAFPIAVNKWMSATHDLYTNVPANGWRDTVKQLRIDPIDSGDANTTSSIDSVTLGKTVRGIQIISNYRKDISKRSPASLGGQYPSVEYPFNLINIANNGEAFNISFIGDDTNPALYVNPSNGGTYTYSGNAAGLFLYEKTYTSVEAQWVLADSFEDGAEYVIASVNNGNGYALTEATTSETGLPEVTPITVENGTIISGVDSAISYSAYQNAVNVFDVPTYWLSSDLTRGFLNGAELGLNCGYGISTPIGGTYTGGAGTLRYAWSYDSANHRLLVSYPNKACSVDGGMPVNFADGSFKPTAGTETGSVYLFKKTYHTHIAGEIIHKDATCTEDGYDKSVCTECGIEFTIKTYQALGHNFVYTQIEGDNTAHKVTCTLCDYNENAAHSYNYWAMDGSLDSSTTHSRTCSICSYTQTAEHIMDSRHVPAAKCGELGYTHHYCTATGCGYHHDVPDPAGTETTQHLWDGGLITVEPSCTTPGEIKYTCTRTTCLETKTETLPAIGHLYNDKGDCLFGCGAKDPDYIENSAKYVYKYVDVPEAGREYVIANTNRAGEAYIAAPVTNGSTEEGLVSVPSTVTRTSADAFSAYISPEKSGPATEWLAEKTGDKFAFKNKLNNTYLWGKNTTNSTPEDDDEWINKNIGSNIAKDSNSLFTVRAASAATSDGGMITSGIGARVVAENDYYLGFENIVSTDGFSVPGQNVCHLNGDFSYLPISGYLDRNGNILVNDQIGAGLTRNLTFDIDFAFSGYDSGLKIRKADAWANSYGSRVIVFGDTIAIVHETEIGNGQLFSNYLVVNSISELTGTPMTYGKDAWHHIRIVSDEAAETVSVYFDGFLVKNNPDDTVSVEGWTFYPECFTEHNEVARRTLAIQPGCYITADRLKITIEEIIEKGLIDPNKVSINNDKPGFEGFVFGNTSTAHTWIDNISAVSDNGLYWYDGFDGNGNIYYSDQIYHEIIPLTEGASINKDANVANNVFIAAPDTTNKLYFFEKQYAYTVNYYYNGVLDASKTDSGYKALGETVTAADKAKPGYYLNNADPAMTLTISASGDNTINVYYVSGYSAQADSFAIDYASTVFTADTLTANDTKAANVSSVTVTKISNSFGGTLGEIYSASQINTTTAASGISASVANGSITVTSNSSSSFTSEFYVEYKFTFADGSTAYTYAKLTVIPATSIYFEDNSGFLTYKNGKYEDGSALNWTSTGNAGSVPAALYDDVYGHSETYNSSSYVKYSGASSKALYITSDTVSEKATASFTFKGTGFDVLSHSNNRTGIVLVDVYNASGARVKGLAVNNYLGYDYIDGKWVRNSGNGEEAYQVPVIKCTDLSYGEYSVVVTPIYQRSLKGDTVKETTQFYLDGVRVYNPLSGNSFANGIYERDGEAYTNIYRVGDIILDNVEDAGTWYNDYNIGAMYISNNGAVTTAADYVKFGPNNEVYLANGSSINFYISAEGGSKPAKVLISASVMNGKGSGTLTVNGNVISVINSGTDMYYDITDYVTWNGNVSGVISVGNSGNGIIALSTVKAAYDAALGTLSFLSYSAPEMISYASQFASDDTVFRTSVLGDIDGSGRLSSRDLLLLKQLISDIADLDESQQAAADMNQDNRISSRDLVGLCKLLLGEN